jgi:hypothetical protein
MVPPWLQQVYDEADALKEEFERHQREYAARIKPQTTLPVIRKTFAPVDVLAPQPVNDWSGWEKWADTKIAHALAAHEFNENQIRKILEALIEPMAEVISEIRMQLRKEFAEQLG